MIPPPNGQTEPALIQLYTVQWLSNVNNLKERVFVLSARLAPMGMLLS